MEIVPSATFDGVLTTAVYVLGAIIPILFLIPGLRMGGVVILWLAKIVQDAL